jgi:hypothetical protein
MPLPKQRPPSRGAPGQGPSEERTILAVAVIDRRSWRVSRLGARSRRRETMRPTQCRGRRGQRARHESRGDAPMVSCIGDPPAGLLLRLGRRLRSTLMGRLVDLPLALTPVLELLARREIARILHYSSPRAATMSGICRCRLKGHGGSQETSNSRSQKHFLPHMFYSVP